MQGTTGPRWKDPLAQLQPFVPSLAPLQLLVQPGKALHAIRPCIDIPLAAVAVCGSFYSSAMVMTNTLVIVQVPSSYIFGAVPNITT